MTDKVTSSDIDLSALSVQELLSLHASIGETLRGRGIVRSANNPTGDLAEYLFCKAFEWERLRTRSGDSMRLG